MRSLALLLGLAALVALAPARAARAADEFSCEALEAQLERTVALVSGLPGPEQARRLDAFQYAHEDPARCIVDRLIEVQNRIERPLIVLHAGGAEVESDKIFRCAALREPRGSCSGAYADDTLSSDERLTVGPSFASAAHCSLDVRWPKAKLIDLYFLSPTTPRRPIIPHGATFDRPPIGTSLVAVYRVGGHDKLRKFVWFVH